MLPILYLILMKRNGTPYSEVTVVSLPSSLRIVHSNAFVFSTCLPSVVFRYGFYLFDRSRFFLNLNFSYKKVVTNELKDFLIV